MGQRGGKWDNRYWQVLVLISDQRDTKNNQLDLDELPSGGAHLLDEVEGGQNALEN